MLLAHETVFDEIITGTGNTWYSSDLHNDMIGAGDILRIVAVATDVVGTPTLNVYLDKSCDNEHWDDSGAALLSAALSTVPVKAGQVTDSDGLGGFGRLRVDMTGTGSVSCRLQLSVTARSW